MFRHHLLTNVFFSEVSRGNSCILELFIALFKDSYGVSSVSKNLYLFCARLNGLLSDEEAKVNLDFFSNLTEFSGYAEFSNGFTPAFHDGR